MCKSWFKLKNVAKDEDMQDLESMWQTFGRLFVKGLIKMVCRQTFPPLADLSGMEHVFGSTGYLYMLC